MTHPEGLILPGNLAAKGLEPCRLLPALPCIIATSSPCFWGRSAATDIISMLFRDLPSPDPPSLKTGQVSTSSLSRQISLSGHPGDPATSPGKPVRSR
jgi:hypothetical protein